MDIHQKIFKASGKTFCLVTSLLLLVQCSVSDKEKTEWSDNIKVVLENTKPLEYDQGNRLPLYLWPAIYPGDLDTEAAEQLVSELAKRGVGIISTWNINDTIESLHQCLTIARAQKKLGKRVNVNANPLLYSFFNGDERTAHIEKNGKQFFDDSFGGAKMGCPFAIDFRKKEIRKRVEFFVDIYKEEGLPLDFIFTDWEIDGPIEVNHAYDASKKCTRCCENMGLDFSFTEFQKTMREMRSYLMHYSYSIPVLSKYPDALVGNYAVYPNDGYRYWYDYFEYYVKGSLTNQISMQNTGNGITISRLPDFLMLCRLFILGTRFINGMILKILTTDGFTICYL